MNWETIEGNWRKFKGQFRQKWGELTDDEFEKIAGKRDHLIGKLQKRFGMS